MSRVNKEKEIELSSGKLVTVQIEVEGTYDANYGADVDGNRGVGRWLIDSHSYEVGDTEEELTSEEFDEIDEKVEALVYDGDWDFESPDLDDEDADDDTLFN